MNFKKFDWEGAGRHWLEIILIGLNFRVGPMWRGKNVKEGVCGKSGFKRKPQFC